MTKKTERTQSGLCWFGVLICVLRASTSCAEITIIGDDDGFGGVLLAPAVVGSAVDINELLAIPSASVGSKTNQTDFRSNGRANLYELRYVFPVNTTGYSAITSAQVTIQTASVGLDADDGFGGAVMTFDNNVIGFLSSPLVGSPEFVQRFTFDVTSFISAGSNSPVEWVLDGSTLSGNDANDIFAVDFAKLSIDGTAIPEPSSLLFLGTAIISCALIRGTGVRLIDPVR